MRRNYRNRGKVRISRISRLITVFLTERYACGVSICICDVLERWGCALHDYNIEISFPFPWRMFQVFCNSEGSWFLFFLFSFLLCRTWGITSLALPKTTQVSLSHVACISASSSQSIFMINKCRETSISVSHASVRGQDGFWECYVAQHHIYAEGGRFFHESASVPEKRLLATSSCWSSHN